MKMLDDIGMKLCEYQADVFEQSVSAFKCSSRIFVKQFMLSDIARRMDVEFFIFEAIDVPACLDELEAEKKCFGGTEKYPDYVMHWIGYMYRYMAYTREISSGFLYGKVKAAQLCPVYEAYHSLDPELAADRILESVGVRSDDPTDHLELARRILL